MRGGLRLGALRICLVRAQHALKFENRSAAAAWCVRSMRWNSRTGAQRAPT